MKFPGIISFLENYPETISMSKIREISSKMETLFMTYGCVRSWILFISVWIFICTKTQFFRSRGRTRRRTRTKCGAPDTKTNSPSSAPRRLVASTSLSAKRTLPSLCASWIFILHQNPVFSIPRSNTMPDANQMLPTGYKNEFSVLCTRRLAASISRSAKRTPPNYFVPH